ncbi:MAG: FAD-binding oxidoreductase [Limibacillus sp.]
MVRVFPSKSAALRLAEAGKDVVLREAAGFGEGGSGRNVGLVNAGLWMPPGDIEAAMGEAAARRLCEPLAEGPARVFSLIERHQMNCEAVREGTIHAAHNRAGLADLKRRHAQWQKLGAPVTLLNEQETALRTGTKVFKGGLFDARAGTINPMGYVRGLARAAINAGADLHGASAVIKLERRDGLWRVETAEGAVTAPKAILATNAYSADLLPGLERAFTPISFYQLATAPLGGQSSGILPGREGLWDTGKIMTAVRVDAAGRLLLGSMGALYGRDAALTKRWGNKTRFLGGGLERAHRHDPRPPAPPPVAGARPLRPHRIQRAGHLTRHGVRRGAGQPDRGPHWRGRAAFGAHGTLGGTSARIPAALLLWSFQGLPSLEEPLETGREQESFLARLSETTPGGLWLRHSNKRPTRGRRPEKQPQAALLRRRP